MALLLVSAIMPTLRKSRSLASLGMTTYFQFATIFEIPNACDEVTRPGSDDFDSSL
jgi:hypothetical protein